VYFEEEYRAVRDVGGESMLRSGFELAALEHLTLDFKLAVNGIWKQFFD